MTWRCKFCGFEIQDREDRRKIQMKNDNVYIVGYCDNCFSWSILYRVPMENMRDYIKDNTK